MHRGRSTDCRPTVHRRLRATQGAKIDEVDMGRFRGTGASSRTWCPTGLLLVGQVAMVEGHVHAMAG